MSGHDNAIAAYESFVAKIETEATDDEYNQVRAQLNAHKRDKSKVETKSTVGKIFNLCVRFLNDSMSQGIADGRFNNVFKLTQGESANRISDEHKSFTNIESAVEGLKSLCDSAGIPEHSRKQTMITLGSLLNRYGSAQETISDHWTSGNSSETVGAESAHTFYGSDPYIVGEENFIFDYTVPGNEAFGQNIDMVLPDIRTAMTMVLLKPLRSISDRIFHKRSTQSPIVRYVIPFEELFDLKKARAETGKERDGWDTRIPFISLYRRPSEMEFSPIRIIPQENLIDGYTLKGALTPEVEHNLFDLGKGARSGTSAVDHTTFVADSVQLESIWVEIKKGADGEPELHHIDLTGNPHSRLNQTNQADDSADRDTAGRQMDQFFKGVLDSSGDETVIFDGFPKEDGIIAYLRTNFHARINRKTSVTFAYFNTKLEVASIDPDVEVTKAAEDLLDDVTAKVIGYTIDARYSEENTRLSSLIIRNNVMTRTFEIPATRNFMYDYSMKEAQPEYVLDSIANIRGIGCGHRDLTLIDKLSIQIHLENKKEENDPLYRQNTDNKTLNTRYAGGSRVNPMAMRKHLTLGDHIETIRTADDDGNVRQFMDMYLRKVMSQLHTKSLYINQLDAGESPHYKVITSTGILENLFAIPHIHNHLMPEGLKGEGLYSGPIASKGGDFTRVLPSGVTFSCVPCTFEYMDNRILIIPYRKSHPESEFNFGHMYDFGTFSANYMPQYESGVHHRALVNDRSFLIPENVLVVDIVIDDLYKVFPDITNNQAAPRP